MPLRHLKILDLSQRLPGPFCSQLLADFGAEVVKVESPQRGDYGRYYLPKMKKEGAGFLMINRNKKSLTLNLKTSAGRKIFMKLLKRFDVVIESFKPGSLETLGIGYEQAKKIHPKIIYCSITAYGQSGPYKEKAGHDLNSIGMSGILDMTGEPGGPPIIPGAQIADIGAGLLAAIAILIAVITREKKKVGQHIDISMLDSVISWLSIHAGNFFATGKIPERGRGMLTGGLACYNVYQTKDGRYISLAALEPHFWKTLCRLLGIESWVSKQFTMEVQDRIKKRLSQIFRKKTMNGWLRTFSGNDICLEPILNIKEVFSHPQLLQRKMRCEIIHPTEGRLSQIGIPIKFSKTPGQIRMPPPLLGEHTTKILKNIGYGMSQIEAWKHQGVI